MLSGRANLAACTNHAMPRQAGGAGAHGGCDLARTGADKTAKVPVRYDASAGYSSHQPIYFQLRVHLKENRIIHTNVPLRPRPDEGLRLESRAATNTSANIETNTPAKPD